VDRDKALDMALGQIEKNFGKGSIMKMGEKGSMKVETISTGSLAVDLALGVGGLPRGRVVEIFGPEASGKSTMAMHVVAEAQRNGGICAYIDAEHAMDPAYAAAIGVDIDELLISQPDTGEQALEIVDMLIRSGALDVVVIDSVAALTPRAEIEGEMGDSHVGLQARLMSQALRKLTANLNKSNTICISKMPPSAWTSSAAVTRCSTSKIERRCSPPAAWLSSKTRCSSARSVGDSRTSPKRTRQAGDEQSG